MGRGLAVRLPHLPEERIRSKRIHVRLVLTLVGRPFALLINRARGDRRPLQAG